MARTQMCSRDRRGVRNEGEEGRSEGKAGRLPVDVCGSIGSLASAPHVHCHGPLQIKRRNSGDRHPNPRGPQASPACMRLPVPSPRGRCRSGRRAVAALPAAATPATPARPRRPRTPSPCFRRLSGSTRAPTDILSRPSRSPWMGARRTANGNWMGRQGSRTKGIGGDEGKGRETGG